MQAVVLLSLGKSAQLKALNPCEYSLTNVIDIVILLYIFLSVQLVHPTNLLMFKKAEKKEYKVNIDD